MSQDRATKGSDLLVTALANEGVDRVFGVPGEENLDVVESLRQSTQPSGLTGCRSLGAASPATA